MFEAITTDEMVDFLKMPAAENAVATEKLENGKKRAIYVVDLIHYTICSYVTNGFEEKMSNVEGFEKGMSGIKEYAAQQKRVRICADPNQQTTMFDHADFNIQHSPEAMARIVAVMQQIGTERGYNADWLQAAEWLRQSKYNMSFIIEAFV